MASFDFWRVLHRDADAEERIRKGDYDENLAELYDMAVRHGDHLVAACKARMRRKGIAIPARDGQAQAVGPQSPDPWKPNGPKRVAADTDIEQ